MKLNYQEIMELPEPRDGADVGTMDSICGVYAQLVGKFKRLLAEARQVKTCWMQQERIDLYAKRLAANQRELRCKERQLRQGEMFNFCLRVREWVLNCPERRLKIRNLIGEARIAKWHAKKLAQQTELAPNKEPQFPPGLNSNHVQFANPQADPYGISQSNYKSKNANRQEVGNWYRLPYIEKRCADKTGPDTHGSSKQRTALPAKGGMCRAVPSVVFWPDELALDYVHSKAQLTAPEKPAKPAKLVHKRRTHVTTQENMGTYPSHKGTHTAKEWPD